MLRPLLFGSLVLLLGCGTESKSPESDGQTPTASTAEKTETTAVLPAPAEPVPAVVPSAAEEKPGAKPVAAEGKPAAEIVALEPPAVPSAKPAMAGRELVLQDIRLAVPGNWVFKKPEGAYLLAEYTLPRAAGDDADGRVTAAMAGTSMKQVIAMWREQFGGQPEKESQEELKILGLWATLVDMSGTYRTRASQSAPFESHADYRMLAAMCNVGQPGQMYFIKAIGPAKTIAAHADEFRAFLGSIKLKQ
jgi:hypothetical protein